MLKANNCWHFTIYEQDKFRAEHENSFITSGARSCADTENPGVCVEGGGRLTTMFYVSFVLISHQHGTDNIRNFYNQSDVCGVEDSVENYQTYLIFIFCGYGVRVLWNPIFFIRFVTHISISLMIFVLNYAFANILFSLRILLLAVEMSDWQGFRSQARQIAVTDPCYMYCTCHFKSMRRRCRE